MTKIVQKSQILLRDKELQSKLYMYINDLNTLLQWDLSAVRCCKNLCESISQLNNIQDIKHIPKIAVLFPTLLLYSVYSL